VQFCVMFLNRNTATRHVMVWRQICFVCVHLDHGQTLCLTWFVRKSVAVLVMFTSMAVLVMFTPRPCEAFALLKITMSDKKKDQNSSGETRAGIQM